MTCRRRFLSALIALFAFLFAQGAVAAHACAKMKAPPANGVITHHESCHEMIAAEGEPVTGNVCVQHCHGDTSVDNVQPSLVAAGLEGPILWVDLSDPPAAWGSRPGRRPPPAAAPPPPAILFGILRI